MRDFRDALGPRLDTGPGDEPVAEVAEKVILELTREEADELVNFIGPCDGSMDADMKDMIWMKLRKASKHPAVLCDLCASEFVLLRGVDPVCPSCGGAWAWPGELLTSDAAPDAPSGGLGDVRQNAAPPAPVDSSQADGAPRALRSDGAEFRGDVREPAAQITLAREEIDQLVDFLGSCDTTMDAVIWERIWRKLLVAGGYPPELDGVASSRRDPWRPTIDDSPPGDWDPQRVALAHSKDMDCPHCIMPLEIDVAFDRGIVALTTVLSGFNETVQVWDLETCFDQGARELEKRTMIRVRRRRKPRPTAVPKEDAAGVAAEEGGRDS